MDHSEEKLVKVEYWQMSFDRYGDRVEDYIIDWVPVSRVDSLRSDRRVSDLKVTEEE